MFERRPPTVMLLGLAAAAVTLFYCFTSIYVASWQAPQDGRTGSSAGIGGFGRVLEGIVHDVTAKVAPSVTSTSGAKDFGQNSDLILYAYEESEEARLNLAFFRRHALHSKADFIFIFNGDHTADISELQHLPNVRVVERENTCFDLGAYWEVLTADDNLLAQAYKRYIFMNASLRGPFLPSSARSVCWSNAYLDRLDQKTKLVGMTWNCARLDIEAFPPHLQSMIWAMESTSLNDIVLPSLKCFESLEEAVWGAEIPMASKVMEAGYEVAAMESRFESHSKTKGSEESETKKFLEWCTQNGTDDGAGSDVNASGMYSKGTSMNPWGTIFVKTNRGWTEKDAKVIELLTDFADDKGYSSYDRCVSALASSL